MHEISEATLGTDHSHPTTCNHVRSSRHLRSARPRWQHAVIGATVAAVVALAACGDDGASGLTPEAAEGRRVANSNGCAGCHGSNGEGTVAPGYVGLYLSTRPLDDGTTVVADDEYLFRAIRDPAAERVEGYSLRMPENSLDDEEIRLVIEYIKELSAE